MFQKIKAWFSHSETLAWARIQTALGVVAAVVTYVDPSVLQPIMPEGWFPWLLVANGLLTEWLRRRNADDLK